MKQRMEFIKLEPALHRWLLAQLEHAPATLSGAAELHEAMFDLQEGHVSSLMMELLPADTPAIVPEERLVCGPLTMYPNSHRVLKEGAELLLTPKEFDILLLLMQKPGQVFTKEQIYQAVWGDSYYMDESNIMAFIHKLRRKIEPNSDAPVHLLTVWGVGYRLVDGP